MIAPRRAAAARILPAVVAAVAALTAVAVPTHAAELPPKQKALFDKLRARIEAVDSRLDGVLAVFVEDLSTGARVEVRPDEVLPAASSIKLAILYELFRQAADRKLDLTELTRPPARRVEGAGVLMHLGGQVSLSWRDLAVLMIGWSDNEAANLLIDRVGMDAVNTRLDGLSLSGTRLRRRLMDLDAAQRGEENVSTPRELARLAAIVARGDGLPAETARDLLAVAVVPDELSPFRRGLPDGQRALTKYGELEGVRCEAAWVDLPGRPYVVAVMTGYLKRDADGEAAITEISTAAFHTFDRLGRSSELGRVISSK
jgi:beta-lactamase class A